MMRIPPSKGQCHAIFLLIHVAGLGAWRGRSEWVAAARQRRTISAPSYDLEAAADALVNWGLAVDEPIAKVHPPLGRLGTLADYVTLKSIAGELLRRRPPIWLRACLAGGKLVSELIPSSDLNALSWLGDDLEGLLLTVYAEINSPEDEGFLAKFGLAGEMAVMSALENSRRTPRHVSLVSDAFGYDIECKGPSGLEGFEIKAATPKTANRFLLSRNEFDVSRRMGERWRVVQVVFSSAVVATGRATISDLVEIRELPAKAIHSLAPSDESQFRWLESVQVTPKKEQWLRSGLNVSCDFEFSFET